MLCLLLHTGCTKASMVRQGNGKLSLCLLIKHLAMICGAPSLSMLAVDEGEWSASQHGHFTSPPPAWCE